MIPSDIFIIEHYIQTTTVALKWDTSTSETVEETDDIGSEEAEAMAIGLLWQEHSQEIIDYIRRYP